jgi:EAL domain-containing protein (putative c-di-GMP-specific phosphodiesterase class I)
VELREQHDFLRAAGCDHIQGWLVSRPMDPGAFEAWWRQRRAGSSRGVFSG